MSEVRHIKFPADLAVEGTTLDHESVDEIGQAIDDAQEMIYSSLTIDEVFIIFDLWVERDLSWLVLHIRFWENYAQSMLFMSCEAGYDKVERKYNKLGSYVPVSQKVRDHLIAAIFYQLGYKVTDLTDLNFDTPQAADSL